MIKFAEKVITITPDSEHFGHERKLSSLRPTADRSISKNKLVMFSLLKKFEN
jgi:hypothetical protein